MSTYKKVKTNKGEDAHKASTSTTKEVFETLDITASRSERWLEKNKKFVIGFIAIVVLVVVGYMGYNKFIQLPKEIEASNELAFPKKYFESAFANKSLDTQIVERDSLLNLGLQGADGKFGFLDIADNYSGTKAGNLAQYYAGISYLIMKDYKNAVSHLGDFKSNDELLSPTAFGAIGDAFADINQPEDALDYYTKAAHAKQNEFTAPLFLFKAGETALNLGKASKGLEFFEEIKKDYPESDQAADIDYYINKAKYSIK